MGIDLKEVDKFRNKVQKFDERSEQGYKSDIEFYKPEEGQNRIRMLPPAGSESLPWKAMGYHYIADNLYFKCPNILHNGEDECPWCQLVDRLFKSNKYEDRRVAGQIQVQVSGVFRVVVRSEKNPVPKVWMSSPKIFKKILSWFDPTVHGDITNSETGKDCLLTVHYAKKKDEVNQYDIEALDRTPLFEDANMVESIMKELPDVERLFSKLDADKLWGEFEKLTQPHGVIEEKIAKTKEYLEKKKEEREQEKKVEETDKPKEVSTGKPECFGVEFNAKSDKCKGCDNRKECLQELQCVEEPKKEPIQDENSKKESSLSKILKDVKDRKRKE